MSYRAERLHSGIKASTINRDLKVLRGMFTVLAAADDFHGENTIKALMALKEKQVEVSYLSGPEVTTLLNSCDLGSDNYRLTLLSLSTGGRWGEVINLDASHIRNGKVTFLKTKSGRKRTAPVTKEVEDAVKTINTGKLFNVDYQAYRRLLKSVKPDMPKGQAVHILRHTFGAHFMINGGNILTLQKILGHANIQQTMTYAHLAPEYLMDATTLNPLSRNIHISSTHMDSEGGP